MHPDFSLVLQKCASNLSLKHKQPVLFSAYVNYKNMSTTASTPEMSNNSQDDTEDLVRIVSDDEEEDEDGEEAGEHGEEIVQRLANGRIHYPKKFSSSHMEQDDNISICSELSVGRENPGDTPHSPPEDEEILDISDTHSNTSNEEMQHSPLNHCGDTPPSINPFTLANTLRFPVPFGLQATASSAVTTNISPFQEEFLRKSHLYAEELMKHQMQLMAAARVSAFSLRTNNLTQLHHPQQLTSAQSLAHLNPLTKIGQISAALTAAAAQQQNRPISHHHSHHQQHHPTLQPPATVAASAAAQQYGLMANDTLAKLSALTKQHSPTTTTQMMSTLNQLQTQMQAHLPGLLNDNNDNLHERALKFSIDNILKADFGRSNSLDSPPQTRKNHQHKTTTTSSSSSSSHRQKLNTSSSSSTSNNTLLSDSLENSGNSLSHHNISPSTQTFSSSLATICTNSNDSSSTAVSSSYSSANGAADLVKSPSPGFASTIESGGNKTNSTSKSDEGTSTSATGSGSGPIVWPAWVYCTRYSDRPSSGPRVRKPKTTKSTTSSSSSSTPASAAASAASSAEKANSPSSSNSGNANEDKRPRTAFSGSQLARLKHEFNENRYLTEKRRQQLSSELGLNEAQIKIWFQNKRAKLKKSSGVKNPLALQLMAQGLYNHSTIPLTREEEELQELQERENANNNNNMTQQPATSAVSS